MKQMSKRNLICVGCAIAVLIVVLGMGIKLLNDKNRAKGVQLDDTFLNEFPFYGSIYEACDWLEQQGYKYTFDELDESVEGKIKNGWSFYASGSLYGVDGIVVMLDKSDRFNSDLIYQNCRMELEELYGAGERTGVDFAWYTDGTIAVGVMKMDGGGVQMQMGPYEGMSKYL